MTSPGFLFIILAMLPKVKVLKNLIYLDHAAGTFLDPEVKKSMEPFLGVSFGNPSSLYNLGKKSKEAIEFSRKQVAEILNSRVDEIIFTAGGTESNNIAIFGSVPTNKKVHVITSVIEHPSVLEPVFELKNRGHKVSLLKVDKNGFVNLDQIKKAVRPETVLISVMYANNEVGTVQAISEIGKWLRQENQKRISKKLSPILFHTDACQAAGALDLNVNRLGVDLLTLNGSKIYGPKQTGVLFVRKGLKLKPVIFGGGQEKGLRSGTENVAGIVGFAKALMLAEKSRDKESKRLKSLRDYFITQVLKRVHGASLNGYDERTKLKVRNHLLKRLPNNINLSFKGLEGEAALIYLDSYNIAVSTGSACSSVRGETSHVLLALGLNKEQAESSLRFSLGKNTTLKEINFVLKVLPGIVQTVRVMNR